MLFSLGQRDQLEMISGYVLHTDPVLNISARSWYLRLHLTAMYDPYDFISLRCMICFVILEFDESCSMRVPPRVLVS